MLNMFPKFELVPMSRYFMILPNARRPSRVRSAPVSLSDSRPLNGNPSPPSGRKARPSASQRDRQPASNFSKGTALVR